METTQQDILADFQPELIQASPGKRLANYFIDLIIPDDQQPFTFRCIKNTKIHLCADTIIQNDQVGLLG